MKILQRSTGFTLVELMVVVAILSILMAIGVPSFTTMIKNNRLTATINDLAGVLHYTRAEAVRRGRNVRVDSISGDVSNGLRVWFDTSGDGNFDSGEELREFRLSNSNLALTADVDGTASTNITMTYNSRGSISGTGNLLNVTVCDGRSGAYGKQLNLLASGVLRLSSNITCS